MRRFAFFPCFLMIACGGHSGGKAVESEVQDPETEGESLSESVSDGDVAPTETIQGIWENSSCGERKYLRRVQFRGDGSFTAVDEVAPCPPSATCVWSGIINWGGSWKKIDEVIEIVPVFNKSSKAPETVPTGFLVLSQDPLSLGERDGDVVCPFKRK